jgi:hypothetical protein
VQRIENALDLYRSEAYWQIVVTTQHRNDGASSDRVYDDLTKLYLLKTGTLFLLLYLNIWQVLAYGCLQKEAVSN